jgi:hypothetical protein
MRMERMLQAGQNVAADDNSSASSGTLSLAERLLELEKKLLSSELRRTPEKLAPLLADDFVEFGSSGHAYDKKQILHALKRHLPGRLALKEFRVTQLGPAAALVTYRARAESADGKSERYSLRSSVWVLRNTNWQMLFHQGTLVPEREG